MRKYCIASLLPVLLFLFTSCTGPKQESVSFELLPLPQKAEFRGESKLKAADLRGYFRQEAVLELKALPGEFDALREKLETVYGESRILDKPDSYLLDQDHHHHLANQSRSFDWQFMAELSFLKKLEALDY